MDNRQRTDAHLERLQARLERELGINPDNTEALELLWKVQRHRTDNPFSVPLLPLEVTR